MCSITCQTFLFACNCYPPCYQAPNNKVVTISWLPNGLPLDKFKRQYLYFFGSICIERLNISIWIHFMCRG